MLRKSLTKLCALAMLCTTMQTASAQQIAFPGAEGYGKYATGGRGGEVCYVTSLDDCTDSKLVEGTLRWAIRHDNGGKPRTILFKVAGTILTKSNLKFNHSDVSVLGQTAPGGGICIAGYKVYISANNVIVRHIRFRAGDLAGYETTKSCASVDIENVKNVILDHCSITWSMEECLTAYDTDSTTVQWSIIGEGLYNSLNSKGARAYATQWGGEHSTMHHCLLTNCNNRVPRFNGVRDASEWYNATGRYTHDRHVESEFANNVMFNWGKPNSAYGGEDDKTINNVNGEHDAYDHIYLINNYWRPGPITQKNVSSTRYFVQGSKSNTDGYGQWYLSGNKFETGSKYAGSGNQWKDANLTLVNNDNLYGYTSNNSVRAFNLDGLTASQDAYDKYVLTSLPEKGLSGMSYDTADEAFSKVTKTAGASLPCYDEVDTRLLAEAAGTVDPKFYGATDGTMDRGLGIINTPNDILLEGPADTLSVYKKSTTVLVKNAYPALSKIGTYFEVIDTDNDGMPDAYEDANGFNKNDAADGNVIADNGYTNLENFLNAVADGSYVLAGSPSVSTGISAVKTSVNTDDVIYDLSGRRVKNPSKGIFIKNNKKIIIK